MKKLNAAERQAQIVELLSNNKTMKIVDLANHFNVSRETIRRDLIVLNEIGAAKKWFGGAISTQEKQDFSIQEIDKKIKINATSKMQICQKALELIPPQAVIFLDNGSTTLYMAKLLKNLSGHIIITTSIPVINTCINSSNKLIICGGVIDPLIVSTIGSSSVDFLKQIKTDVAILGSSGFKMNNGPTGNNFEYSQIKKTAIKNAQTSIVLADSSKATYSSLIQYVDWDEIDYLVTNSDINPDIREKIESKTNIIYANKQ